MSLPMHDELIMAEEFLEMFPETNKKCELIDGVVVTGMASPGALHQKLVMRLSAKIDAFIASKGGDCEVFPSPFDAVLDDYHVVQPDVLVNCDRSKNDGKRINGAPDLVIEITSSNKGYDYNQKTDIYRRAGVREYWIIDPDIKRTMVFAFGEKSDFSFYAFDKSVPVGIFGGELEINISELTE